ncbi:DUF4232 domain-containing protein [Nocardioides conyzicola]
MSALLLAGLLTATGAPAQAQPPTCTNAQLTASYRGGDAATSHRYGRIVLRNTSDQACTIHGYGGLSYVGGGDGTQVGAAATRTSSRVRTLLVRPGQRVVSAVVETSWGPYAGRCRRAHVDGFRVYLPDETRAQFVPHPTTGCRNSRVHLLAHRAYRRP